MKVLLLGGCGYIGSRVYGYLTQPTFNCISLDGDMLLHPPPEGFNLFDVTSIDLEWYGNQGLDKNIKRDYRTLTKEEIAPYDAVLLFAAYSSPALCKNSGIGSVLANNIDNFVDLLPKLRKGQKFIYASSITVYQNTSDHELEETESITSTPSNSYDFSKKECDAIMQMYPEVEFYGLRLATVCGISRNWRTDIMINSMTDNALITNEIKLFNPKNYKPILSANDLCRAIETILLNPNDNRGFYNLASYNGVTEEIAEVVADVTNAKLRVLSDTEMAANKLPTTGYNLRISTKKFEDTFDFKFHDITAYITNEIVYALETAGKHIQRTKRVDGIFYES